MGTVQDSRFRRTLYVIAWLGALALFAVLSVLTWGTATLTFLVWSLFAAPLWRATLAALDRIGHGPTRGLRRGIWYGWAVLVVLCVLTVLSKFIPFWERIDSVIVGPLFTVIGLAPVCLIVYAVVAVVRARDAHAGSV